MKKKIILTLIAISCISLVGCTNKEESFEDKVIRKFTYVDSAQSKLEAKVEDMEAQIEILKKEVGLSDTAKFTEKDINFSSVKVQAKEAKSSEGEVLLPANSNFNLSIDVMNTTEENLSQMIVQAYLTYNRNGQYYDRHLVDTRFDVLPKSVRKQIEFKDIPVMDANTEHILTIVIKDVKGSTITSFEKTIHVK